MQAIKIKKANHLKLETEKRHFDFACNETIQYV